MEKDNNQAFKAEQIIFTRDEIDDMDIESIRNMFCESQTFQLKLKMQNDRLRQAAQKALEERDNQSKSMASIIHDMRNAIGAISGIEEILSRDETLTPKQHEFIKALKLSVDTLREAGARVRSIVPSKQDLAESSSSPVMQLRDNKEKKYKILLVEDDASNILIVSTFLESLDYQYDVASTGEEVLEKARDSFYSLILMDINIPGIDGLGVTSRLRRLEEEGLMPRTPIVAMTAHALVEDRQKCMAVGMDDYISKPFSQEQLQQKVEKNICFSHPAARMAMETIA